MSQYGSSLIEAIQESNLDSVAAHLTTGADPNSCTRLGLSALHVAAVRDEIQMVNTLIRHGANVNMVTGWGSSVLHMAAHRGSLRIVHILLDHAASPNVTDDNSDTPLHLACNEGHVQVAAVLVKRGADCTIRNNAGKTALDESIENNMSQELLAILNNDYHAVMGTEQDGVDNYNTEFVPDDDFPTNESYSSLIDNFSFTERAPFIPHREKSEDLLDHYTGTKSMGAAQTFSFLGSNKSITAVPAGATGEKVLKTNTSATSKIVLDSSITSSIDLSQPSFSLSKMLNFTSDVTLDSDLYSNSIDSTVFRETYQMYQAAINNNNFGSNDIQSGANRNLRTHGNMFGNSAAASDLSNAGLLKSMQYSLPNLDDIRISNSINSLIDQSFSGAGYHGYSAGDISRIQSQFHQPKEQQSAPHHYRDSMSEILRGTTDITPPISPQDSTSVDEKSEGGTATVTMVDSVISALQPMFDSSSKSLIKTVLRDIIQRMGDPWPSDSPTLGHCDKEWICGEDYVLPTDRPLNIGCNEREGSCSLVFKILHDEYGPLVLKMMVNLLNQTDHDSGQSGTVWLRKQFSAEHLVPISLSYHANVVQILHCYNATTAPFKKYLHLLVPPCLDVDVDMASRTSFMVMREYPLSMRNYVNKFVEYKAKHCLVATERIERELKLVLLLVLQCLFSLHHLHSNSVIHRDIKLDNFMMRNSGQVILIDFGLAVNLVNADGSPAVALEKNDIIAGNPLAWSPEITHHHQTFTNPLQYRQVYRSSDVYTLGKMFIAVFEVFGFLEKDGGGEIHCPARLTDIPLLARSLLLLRQMSDSASENRIDLMSAILYLGYYLFLSDCKTVPQVLSKLTSLCLTPTAPHPPNIAQIGSLSVIPTLYATVCKYFFFYVPTDTFLDYFESMSHV